MSTPVVSVILPTFNRLQYLRPTVNSVFAQTLSDWELIVADDGSDAETRAYLEALESPPRVRVIWLPHSGNPSAVRNAALREARGEYVAFLDSDDIWMPVKLELQVASLRARTRCRWVYTGWMGIDEAGAARPYSAPRPWVPYRGPILEQLLTLDASVATASVLVERRLLAEVGGFDEEQRLFEHYDLWLRLAAHSEVELIDQPLTCLRSHEQHYSEGGIASAASRHRLLGKMRVRAGDARIRRLVERLYAQSALDLASRYANTSRRAALGTLARSCTHSAGHLHWWTGAPRVLLKVAVPRGLLTLYRRGRARPGAKA
jgi:glycosyltransferase involved in cell wall biosynthesis